MSGRFEGSGECFVFALHPKVAVYRWTGANDLFMVSTREYIAMGGGCAIFVLMDDEQTTPFTPPRTAGRYAFYISTEFQWGTSEVSNTFLNRRLSSGEEFQIAVVELWSLTTDSDSDSE